MRTFSAPVNEVMMRGTGYGGSRSRGRRGGGSQCKEEKERRVHGTWLVCSLTFSVVSSDVLLEDLRMYFAPWCSYCEWWRSCCLHVVLASPIHLPYHADFFHFWLYWRILCRCNVRFSLWPHVLFVFPSLHHLELPLPLHLLCFIMFLCFLLFASESNALVRFSVPSQHLPLNTFSNFIVIYCISKTVHLIVRIWFIWSVRRIVSRDRCTQSVCVSCSTCSFRLGRILPYSLGVYGVIQHIFSFVVFAKEGTEYSMSIACPSSSSPSSFASSSSQPSTSPDCSITLPSSPPSSSASPKPLYSQNKSATTLIARVRKMIMSTTSTSNSQSNDSQLTNHLWS